MNNNYVWKRERQKKLNEQRKMQSAYYGALKQVLGRFTQSSIPTVKAIEEILKRKVGRIVVSVYKKSLVDGLSIVEQAYGRPLPILRKSDVEIAKVDVGDLGMLGIATDMKLVDEVGMIKVKTVSKNYHADLRRKHAQMLERGASTGNMAEAFEIDVRYFKYKTIIAKQKDGGLKIYTNNPCYLLDNNGQTIERIC